jgi:CheY-like chemotaxis protein
MSRKPENSSLDGHGAAATGAGYRPFRSSAGVWAPAGRDRPPEQQETACPIVPPPGGCFGRVRPARTGDVENDTVKANDGTQHERPVILVVEDEALTIMDLSDVLDAAGYEALQSASAERALGLLTGRSDIVALITDVELSGKTDGFDLARSAAQMRPDLPIVVVSGRSKPDPDRMPAHARFVARPCGGEDILEVLRTLMKD